MQSQLQESSADPAWEQLAPLLDKAIGQFGQGRPQRRGAPVFSKQKRTGDRRRIERPRIRRAKAAEPRGGEAARLLPQAWCDSFRRRIDRRALGQFRPRRAGPSGGVRHGGFGQRNRRQQFNLNPHPRSIENYGMDKSKNGNRSRRERVARGRHNHCGNQYQHHRATRNDVSREAWVYSGYGDPKSAMLTFLDAIRQADGEQILAQVLLPTSAGAPERL